MKKPVIGRKRCGLAAASLLLFGVLAMGAAVPAKALTAGCQADLDKYSSARLEVIQRINAFNKRRPTPKLACSTFNELVKSEGEMMKWLDDNKDWCQLPEPFVEDFRKNTQTGIRVRARACTAAKREGQARARQSQAPRGPAPGGVQLPKGAL